MKTRTIGAGALAAALLAGTAFLAAPAANAAQVIASDQAGVVVAQDQTSMLRAAPSAPRAVTVTAEPGSLVTINAKGAKARTAKANKDGQATFAKLKAGKTYTVSADGQDVVVVPVINVGKASDLTVMTTNKVDTVDLTWQHKATKTRGGNDITYIVTATPADGSEPISIETSELQAELTGLDPTVLYSFSVTPHNAIGDGKASVARMTRSLVDVTGLPLPVAQENADDDAPAPTTPKPTPAPAPKPGPAPAPKPSTRTIWVCPSGYNEVGGVCTQTQDYTFHDEKQTQDYTYTTDRRLEPCSGSDCPGSEYKDFGTDWSGTGCPNGGTLHDGKCLGWTTGQKWVTYQVKDAPPMGWYDDGSQYAHDVQVKDATPAGWSDNGSQWIRTTAKVEKVVPA